MRKNIFSKFSNDRNDNYKIRTDIYEDNGKRFVVKAGVTDGGKNHIANVFSMYNGLKKQADNTAFDINKSTLINGELQLEYLKGETLEKLLDEALKNGQRQRFDELVKKYTENVRAMAKKPFSSSKEYLEIFGEKADVDENALSMDISDIDMIFANVMVEEDKWTVIDYEWSFIVSIPVDFVLFRTLHYYAVPDRKSILENIDLYDLMGINREKEEIYVNMENCFQTYIIRDNKPLWQLYDSMGKPFYDMPGIAYKLNKDLPSAINVLKDDTTVSDSVNVKTDDDNNKVAVIKPKEDAKVIMFNPSYEASVIRLISIKGLLKNGDEYEPAYLCNGRLCADGIIIFKEDNPYIMTDDIKDGTEKIVICYRLAKLGKDMSDDAASLIDVCDEADELKLQCYNLELKNSELGTKLDKVMAEDYQVVMELQAQTEALEHTIKSMENSTSWKITKPLRKLRKR